ncbi:MAG: ferredoxin--NADP reductase [Planctomycetes bacterium]|nr:ferredoxin--NADP reductase [Planctomycetota bacterium]
MTTPDPWNAVLVAREDLGPRLAVFRVRPDTGAVADFEPGQFVQIGLPMDASTPLQGPGAARPGRVRMHKRSYSIASAPVSRAEVELYVARVDSGRFTPILWAMRPGDRLWLDPEPKGFFTLARVPAERDLVLVATGTGLAPYVSMLRHHAGSERWRRAVVIHGVRRPDELGYRAELAARAARDPHFAYVPVVSRPEPADAWKGLTGRVQVALEPDRLRALGVELDPARTHVFLCGNPEMIRDVRALLEPLGYRPDALETPGSLHFEKYW